MPHTHSARVPHLPFGLWLVAAPWILDGASVTASAVSVIAGLVLTGLSLPRGRRSAEHYAGWDRYIV